MIDSVSVNNDNLIVNKGEGSVPSPPPSPSNVKNSESGQTRAAVEVDLQLNGQLADRVSRGTEQAVISNKQLDENLEKQLKETVESLNEKLARLEREVLFKVDKKIDKSYISVIDKVSKEIIREFPPEEIRTFIARFDEINEKLMMSTDIKSLIINLEV